MAQGGSDDFRHHRVSRGSDRQPGVIASQPLPNSPRSHEEWVGKGWFTSTTKVIDNAIVGFCIAEGLVGRAEIDEPEERPATNSRRVAWTVEDLESDLDEFGTVLRAAGLKDNTISTYVGAR